MVKIIYCGALFTGTVNAQQLISGSASVTLTGPASKEETLNAQTDAISEFRKELLYWINEDAELTIDTTNAVQRKSFSMFVDSCRTAAKSETAFKGKILTLTYMLTAEQARTKLKNYNAAVDKKALEGWQRLKEVAAQNDTRGIYSTGIRALFYSMAHLGPPVATPESEGRDLADDIRRIVQPLFDKMKISSSNMIFKGKTGLIIKDPPTITALIDSTPFPDMTFSGALQNGAIIFTLPTNGEGKVVLSNIRVPFVANGTLLEAFPNVAPQLGIPGFVNPTHFGIRFNKGQVQTFIFKVDKPTYTLSYKAASVSNITMPPDFAKESLVKKFLRDSCFLKESGGASTDLAISITTQVSSYSYDKTEEVGIKVTSQIIVDGLLLTPKRTNEQQFVFEKRYGMYVTPPYGLFFWEANGKLRDAIKAAIGGL